MPVSPASMTRSTMRRRRPSGPSAKPRREPPTPAGTLVSQVLTLFYFGFFALMPWWSRMGTFKPVPDRIKFEAH